MHLIGVSYDQRSLLREVVIYVGYNLNGNVSLASAWRSNHLQSHKQGVIPNGTKR